MDKWLARIILTGLMVKITKFPAFLLLIFFLAGCDNSLVFEENHQIHNGEWNKSDVQQFLFKITDTAALNNVYVNIRNTTDYQYSNIYFFIDTQFPDSRKFRDTVECFLADISGKWLGKGMGKVKDNQIPLRKMVRFPDTGTYSMQIEQAMRTDVLKGIVDIGIRIEKQK